MDTNLFFRYYRFLLTGVIFATLGFLSKDLRQVIRFYNISDFGLSDFLPSFAYVVGISFIFLFIAKKKTYRVIVWTTVGALIYELEQYFTNRTFDYKDIIATILGAFFAFMLFLLFKKRDGS